MTISSLGIIGDVHCEDEHLKIALDFLVPQKLDTIICVGDIVDGPGDLHRTLTLLSSHNVQSIAGNHERWLLANEMRDLTHALNLDLISPSDLDYIRRLPKTIELSCPDGKILICHGLMESDESAIKPHDFGYALEVNEDFQKLLK